MDSRNPHPRHNLGLQFAWIAGQHAKRPALRFGPDAEVSYSELQLQSDAWALALHEMGLGKGQVLAIAGDKTAETFAVLIAALKLGVTYCILDPETPTERLRRILERCRPVAVHGSPEFLVQNAELEDELGYVPLQAGASPWEGDAEWVRRRVDVLTRKVTGNTPAYIMFTSGSTGFPKGAVMTHANVLNFIAWSLNEYDQTPEDVFTNVNPLYFDNSVFDIYSSLFTGATLVPVDKQTIRDPGRFVDLLETTGCTIWFSVPSLLMYLQTLKVFTPNRFEQFRVISFGGEGFPKAKLKNLWDLYHQRIDFVNVYGPTECTCICSAHHLSSADFEDLKGYPTLGTLIPDFEYLILDEDLAAVAPGETGELCLRGPNVGLGYYNDPERTAAAFVPVPGVNAFGERLYRTGDLVHEGVDGKLYIHGRADNQVKHMGYRIELEEIENALCRLDYVNQAVVMQNNGVRTSQLVAVLAADEEHEPLQVQSDLRQHLPEYMIPGRISFVAAIPKNKNGKIDRAGLKARLITSDQE